MDTSSNIKKDSDTNGVLLGEKGGSSSSTGFIDVIRGSLG